MLSAVLAAGMTASASMARTFKEGQAMVTPIYLLSVMPLIFIQLLGLVFDARTAAVPVLNAVLLLKDSLAGTIGTVPLSSRLLRTLLFCGIALKPAARYLAGGGGVPRGFLGGPPEDAVYAFRKEAPGGCRNSR